jgi:membrane associated rhomboid family serine protease
VTTARAGLILGGVVMPPTRSRAVARRSPPDSFLGALFTIGMLTAVLWVVEYVNAGDDQRLDRYGIVPHDAVGLRGILFAPFLHAGWDHLYANTLPFLVLGWLTLLHNGQRFFAVTALVMVGSGFGAWLLVPRGALIVGASGVIFGWLGYIAARGFYDHRIGEIVLGVALVLGWGFFRLLDSLSPLAGPGIAWQAHLCGFLAGVFAAYVFRHPAPPATPRW